MQKSKEGVKRTITEYKTIDLGDLYVSRIPEGKKRVARVPMTVMDFIEHLSSFDMKGTIEYSEGYYGGYGELVVTSVREETDAELEERMRILRQLEEQKKNNERNRKLARKNDDIDTLRRLAKKYKLNIDKDIDNI